MVDMFVASDKYDKYFNEGVYAPKKEEKVIKKDPEEVVHIDDEIKEEASQEEEIVKMEGENE